MSIIPENKNTTEYQIESKVCVQDPRSYLGMSSIGKECLRAQWFSWRWATKQKIIARVNRIFNRGHLEESSIITDLKSIGIQVFRRTSGKTVDLTGNVGETQETLYGFEGHAMGHPDGRLLGVIESPKTEHLLEIKTMKNSKFEYLTKNVFSIDYGIGLKKAYPDYYGQLQRYMDEMKLKRALFIATNKDTQSRKYVRIKFDPQYAKVLKNREEQIILSEEPPMKRFKPEHFNCTWCDHHQICHYKKDPVFNCRTCTHGEPVQNAKWICNKKNKMISLKRQLRGCKKYKKLFN